MKVAWVPILELYFACSTFHTFLMVNWRGRWQTTSLSLQFIASLNKTPVSLFSTADNYFTGH